MKGTYVVRKNITDAQRNEIFRRLGTSEFYTFGRTKHEPIYVRNKRPDYPGYGEGESVPVGFLGKDACLENTDLNFPDNYHSRLGKLLSV